MLKFEEFLARYSAELQRRGTVRVADGVVESPADRPDLFHIPSAALPVGQTHDYVASLPNGSRVHAQWFLDDGRRWWRYHVDMWDPEQGAASWLAHGLLETPLVPVIVAGAVIVWIARRR